MKSLSYPFVIPAKAGMTKRGVDDSLIICLFYYLSTKWEMIHKY